MRRAAPLLLAALAGCAAPHVALAPAPSLQAAPSTPRDGGLLLASEARDALDRSDTGAAIQLAELSVAASPQTLGARETLARSYAAAGRYDAAVQTWDTVLAAAPQQPSALLGRALALLASGNRSAALAALDQMSPSGDVGLAYALAGDPRGRPMIDAAARMPGAPAKVRQNLALAHAIAGDWTSARAIAATDLPPEAVTARLADWSRIATAEPKARVAMLLGIVPAAGVAAPSQVTVHRAAPPTIVIVPRPVMPRVVSQPRTPKPMTIALTMPAAAPAGWVVQLGAYPSAAEADGAWARLRDLAPLKGQQPARVAAHGLVRVSVASYPDRLSAQRLCVKVKQAGADCFVRLDSTGAKPV